MKIILREHVEHLGDRGDEVNVAPGYARNFLLPKGLAYRSGAGSAKQISDQRRAWAVREDRSDQAAQALAAQLAALDLSVRRRAGERGTLYGSVTNGDIATLLAEAGHKIERRKIQLKDPIKSLGTFELEIKLHRSVIANVTLAVLTESGQTLDEVAADKATLEPAVQPRTASGEDDFDDDDDETRGPARGAEKEVRED
jgi:large subunit ribosomal protein L9